MIPHTPVLGPSENQHEYNPIKGESEANLPVWLCNILSVNHAFITLHNLNLESVLGIQYTFLYLLEPLRISQTLDTVAPRVRGKSQCGCVIFFQSIMPL